MFKTEQLKRLYDLTIDVWRDPQLYEEKDIAIEWLDIAYVQEIADELIDKDICPRCGKELRLDRNSSVASLKCCGCGAKY